MKAWPLPLELRQNSNSWRNGNGVRTGEGITRLARSPIPKDRHWAGIVWRVAARGTAATGGAARRAAIPLGQNISSAASDFVLCWSRIS